MSSHYKHSRSDWPPPGAHPHGRDNKRLPKRDAPENMVGEPKMLHNGRDPTELLRYGGAPKVIVCEETTATHGAQRDGYSA